jgi:hypothetical protein
MSYTENRKDQMDLLVKDSISSLDLCEQINIFRQQEGRSKLKHYDLLKVIRDEFEEEIGQGKISSSSYLNSQGKQQPMYILTLSQAKQVLVREHKTVRRAVIKYIEILEEQLAQAPVLIELSKEEQTVIELYRAGGVQAVSLGKELKDVGYKEGLQEGKQESITEVCDNGLIAIKTIMRMIAEEYPEEWKYVANQDSIEMVWSRYLRWMGYANFKRFPKVKNPDEMENRSTLVPTDLFYKVFVDNGYATVYTIDDSRNKPQITYTRKIQELIQRNTFKNSFFRYLKEYEPTIYICDDELAYLYFVD